MNGVSDQLLARARFPPDEDRRVRCSHLRHLLVHLAHGTARPDDAREVVALLQLLPQVQVLVDQALLVFFDQPLNLDRLADARSHDAEELHVSLVVAIGIELEVDSERADRLPVEQDRHAHEAQLLFRQLGALRRAIEERRLLADARHDDRLAAFDHAADNAFAHAVPHGVRRRIEPVRGFHLQLTVVVQEDDEAAHRPVVLRQDLECPVQCRSEIERAGQRLADLEQRGEPLRLARLDEGGIGLSRFSHSAACRRRPLPHR